MAAAVREAMPPPPPYPLQECLKVVAMSADGATKFMEAHHIVTIEGILLFHLIKAQDLMTICNGQKTHQTNKFRMAVQKKLSAFIYWMHDLQQRQEPIIYTFWTQPQLVLSVQ